MASSSDENEEKLHNFQLITGGADSTLKIWKIMRDDIEWEKREDPETGCPYWIKSSTKVSFKVVVCGDALLTLCLL